MFDLQLAALPECAAQLAATPPAGLFFEAAGIVSLSEPHLLCVLRRKIQLSH